MSVYTSDSRQKVRHEAEMLTPNHKNWALSPYVLSLRGLFNAYN
jgi:hypothetical protein